MRRSDCFVLAAAVWLCISPLSTRGEDSDDPHLGTWKLNQEKSTPASPGRKAQRVPAVLKIRPVENGHRFVSVWVTGNGRGVRTEYTARYDGKEYPRLVTTDGRSVSGTISIRRIDEYTLEHTFCDADGNTTVQMSVVSTDGQTRSDTIIGSSDKEGVAVYERLPIFSSAR